MFNVTISTENANGPREPALITCAKCQHVAYKGAYEGRSGDPTCPHCEAAYPKPELHSFEDSDNWIEQNKRERRSYMRWKHWQELAAVRTVPRSHARYAAYMAFRCYLLDQGGGLRRADNNQIADIATIIILSVRRDDEGFFWFGDLLLDHELGEDLYKPIYDESDKGMASALMSLAALLNSEIGSRDDILPNDHDVIKGAF